MAHDPQPEAHDVGSFEELERLVERQHGADWAAFLRALENPAEVLQYVLTQGCGGDEAAFERWFRARALPEDWLRRFRVAQINAGLRGAPADE